MVKNLFIDCGTNLGQGLNEFNKKFNLFNNINWDIYTFEPNPYIDLKKMFFNVNNIIKIDKAIWINNDPMQFICKGKKDENLRRKYNEERFQGGGSQIKCTQKNYNIPEHVETDIINIQTINFSDFLKDKSNIYDKIYVKMDIEGAEFQIIDHLIECNTLNLIYELYIEPHGRFEFNENQWLEKKEEIDIIENILINKCNTYIKNVYKWS